MMPAASMALIISLVFLPVAPLGRPAPGRAPPCNMIFLLSFISLVFLPVALFGRPAPGRAPPCNLNFLLSFPLVDRLSLLVNVWSPTDDRAHAAVSHVGCARRNARQVLPPSSQLRICAQIPQNRGVFKSTEITNVLDNIK